MKIVWRCAIGLLLLTCVACANNPTPTSVPAPQPTGTPSATPTASPTPNAPTQLVGYLAGWNIYGSRKYRIANLPADKLTHLNYAFATVSTSSLCVEDNPSGDHANFAELQKLQTQDPALKMLISLGGAEGSKNFPRAAQSAETRQKFAQSCVAFMRENGFVGIDVDWEFPANAEQKQNFALMLAELRAQLDAAGKANNAHYLLTIAAPAGASQSTGIAWEQVARDLDWINLMTYDFAGSWSKSTGFNAPLFASPADPSLRAKSENASAAVQAYITAGVPASKIVLGVPFYGRGWKGVPDVNHGLYQIADGVPKGTQGGGAFDYRDLKNNYLPTYTRFWSDSAQVPWLFNPTTGVMISYDDPESLGIKADYARTQKLGGVMIWELATDDEQHSLINAIYERLR